MWKGKNGFYNRYLKRLVDIVCVLLAFGVFWWLYLLVGILVRVKLGSPVIFKQARPGRIDPKTGEERIFYLHKFRSMVDAYDANGEPLPDEQRLPKFGKFLRATSLDELPEAWDILVGDMSVIGPRPLLVKYLPYYTPEQRHRHDVRPGLSGYAQVNGRNTVSWEDKFKMDLIYVENVSFRLDVKIIFQTVFKAFIRQEGISSATSVTMDDFAEYMKAKQSEETV